MASLYLRGKSLRQLRDMEKKLRVEYANIEKAEFAATRHDEETRLAFTYRLVALSDKTHEAEDKLRLFLKTRMQTFGF